MLDWVKVGAKVKCVDVKDMRRMISIPVKGGVYTIRNVYEVDGQLQIHLNEISNEPRNMISPDGSNITAEPGFRVSRFKPVNPFDLPHSLTGILLKPRNEIVDDVFDKYKFVEPPRLYVGIVQHLLRVGKFSMYNSFPSKGQTKL